MKHETPFLCLDGDIPQTEIVEEQPVAAVFDHRLVNPTQREIGYEQVQRLVNTGVLKRPLFAIQNDSTRASARRGGVDDRRLDIVGAADLVGCQGDYTGVLYCHAHLGGKQQYD